MQKTRSINFRLDMTLINRIEKICELRRETKATFLRRIILTELGKIGFLTKEEQKVFRMMPMEEEA